MFGLSDRAIFSFAVLFYGLSAAYSIFLLRRDTRVDNRINYLLLLAARGFRPSHHGHVYARLFSGALSRA